MFTCLEYPIISACGLPITDMLVVPHNDFHGDCTRAKVPTDYIAATTVTPATVISREVGKRMAEISAEQGTGMSVPA